MSVVHVLDSHFFQELDAVKRQPVDAVPTSFPTWDRLCRDEGGGVGLARGWQVIVGGNPSIGKSTIALNLVESAMKNGFSPGLLSLEMSNNQGITRLMAITSGISLKRLEAGKEYCTEDAFSAELYFKRHWEQRKARLHFTDEVYDLDEIESVVETMADNGCKLVVIDYLQLVNSSEDESTARVADVARATRRLAKRAGVVVVGISQLTRAAADSDESPKPQGLYGGAVLEQSADQVILIDHTTFKRHGHFGDGDMLIAKNRHGAQGSVPIRYDYRTLRIEEHHE